MMSRLTKVVTPICVMLVAVAAAYAENNKETQVASEKCASECQACPITKAMEALPQLVYRIGDQTTTSPVQAGRLSGKLKKKIEFVVQDKVFKEETVAFAALVDMTEKFVGDFAEPHKCDVSGKTFVAGTSHSCEVAAGQVTKLVKKAMDDVKVTYKVGEKSVCCPDEAKALAKTSGKKVVQLVAGEKCGGCSTTTRLSLARAKYKAAVEALLASNTKEAKKVSDTENKVTEVTAS